jgi:isopenicillin N synthase-like dioxygenase
MQRQHPAGNVAKPAGGSHDPRDARAGIAFASSGACRDIGFLVVCGHGVPDDLIAEMERVSTAFFDQPRAE